MSIIDPSYPIAPSELVLLKRLSKNRILEVQGLHLDPTVSVSQFGWEILAAAILANETVRNIRLEVRQDTFLFGLIKSNNLYANPISNPIEWPEYSLEEEILESADYLKSRNKKYIVSKLISSWLGYSSDSPWQKVNEKILYGLYYRDLLEKHEETKRRGFIKVTFVNFKIPHRTASLLSQQPIQPIDQMLENCRLYRREVWDLMLKQIDSAIRANKRTGGDVDGGSP